MPIDRRDATVRLATALLLAATPTGSVRAEDAVEAFYKGRQINLIVGYGPGGGYDLTARLLARHFGRFMPGNPSIAVQNLAGAGSLRAANFLYGAAPKDGATFGVFGSDIPMIGLLGTNSAVQFDARKFTWLGSSSSFRDDAYVLIVRADAKSPRSPRRGARAERPSCSAAPGRGRVTPMCRRSCAMRSASISSKCSATPTRRRSSSLSSAASSTAAPSISPRSRRCGPGGSRPTAASMSWCSSPA
jgi:hypothetical protein